VTTTLTPGGVINTHPCANVTPVTSLAMHQRTRPSHDALNDILRETHENKEKVELKELPSKDAQLMTQVKRPRVALSKLQKKEV
jgi:hypothetical protein